MEWFYSGLGGINQEEGSAGFSKIIIKPEIIGDLTWVKSSYQSQYGLIRSEWKKENNILEMKVEIPANTNAKIYFPIKQEAPVTESGHDHIILKNETGKYYCKVGSGSYVFQMGL
jgi:hypothetical protein